MRYFLLFAVLFALAAYATPRIIGNVIIPHRQTPSTFPDASTFNIGGILADLDGGVYISDGVSWSKVCTLSTGCP